MAKWIVLCTVDGKQSRLSVNGAPLTKLDAERHVLQMNPSATEVKAFGPLSDEHPQQVEWSMEVLDARAKASPDGRGFLLRTLREQAQRGYTLLNADDVRRAQLLFDSWRDQIADVLQRIDESGRQSQTWGELPVPALLIGGEYFDDLEAWQSYYHAVQSRTEWLEALAMSPDAAASPDTAVAGTPRVKAKGFWSAFDPALEGRLRVSSDRRREHEQRRAHERATEFRRRAGLFAGVPDGDALRQIADALDQLLADHDSKQLNQLDTEHIAIGLLGDAIANGAFRGPEWRLFREALNEYPHIGTALQWIKSHTEQIAVTLPPPKHKQFDWVEDGIPVLASLIRRDAPPDAPTPTAHAATNTTNSHSAGDGDNVCAVQVVFADVVKYSLRSPRLQKEVVTAFTSVCKRALESLSSTVNSGIDAIALPTGDGMGVGFVKPDSYDVHLRFALKLLEFIAKRNQEPPCPVFREHGLCNCHSYFTARIGISDGKAIIFRDINENRNMAGKPVNEAARVMGIADGMQILLSDNAFTDLADFADANLAKQFHRYADIEVKHGVKLTVHQFVGRSPGVETGPSKAIQRQISGLGERFRGMDDIVTAIPRELIPTDGKWSSTSVIAVNNALGAKVVQSTAVLDLTVGVAEHTPHGRYQGTPRVLAMLPKNPALHTKDLVWVYFHDADNATLERFESLKEGRRVKIRGVIGRADIETEGGPCLNIDINGARFI